MKLFTPTLQVLNPYSDNMNQQIQVNLSQTSGLICEHCQSPYFKESLILRKVSRFITGGVQDAIMPVPVLLCNACGQVCTDALAPEIKEMFKAEAETIVEDPSPEDGGKVIQLG